MLLLACVAVVVFVHVEAKKESFGRDKEKDALIFSSKSKKTQRCVAFSVQLIYNHICYTHTTHYYYSITFLGGM